MKSLIPLRSKKKELAGRPGQLFPFVPFVDFNFSKPDAAESRSGTSIVWPRNSPPLRQPAMKAGIGIWTSRMRTRTSWYGPRRQDSTPMFSMSRRGQPIGPARSKS